MTLCRKTSRHTVVVRQLEQGDIYCKYRRWRSRSVALPRAVSHFSLAICPGPVASLLCWCCSPTRPARDAVCPPCARSQERWYGQRELAWTTLDAHLGDICMGDVHDHACQHAPSDLPTTAGTHGRGPLQTKAELRLGDGICLSFLDNS